MHLSDFDLEQLDEARLSELTASQKETLLKEAVADLQEARERLKANSRTNSRPPSSDAPWSSTEAEAAPEAETEALASAEEGDEPPGVDRESEARGDPPAQADGASQAEPSPGALGCPG